MPPPTAPATRLATRQHGVVSRRQLLELGVSRHTVDRQIALGQLLPLHRGTYAVGHAAIGSRGAWMAAALAGGAGAAISHRAAAALHGLLPAPSGPTDIVVTGCRSSRPGLVVHTGAGPESIVAREGIPCTSVARTLVDVASLGNAVATERAWRAAASRRLIQPGAIGRELARGRGGTALIRRLLEEHTTHLAQRTREELERRALTAIDRAGVAPPEANRLLRLRDRWIEADLLWPEPRLIVELDGWSTHGNPDAFQADRQRDVELQLAGWRVARLTWNDITRRGPATMSRLRALLSQPPLRAAKGWTSMISSSCDS
jgi:predicted transcriptional regulator of viral defense system